MIITSKGITVEFIVWELKFNLLENLSVVLFYIFDYEIIVFLVAVYPGDIRSGGILFLWQ